MKAVFTIIFLFIFTATATTYAGLFNNQLETNDPYNNNGAGYWENNNYQGVEADEDRSGFFRSSSAGNPSGRPGNGDGIGQDAPLSKGVHILAICCLIYCIAKFSSKKRSKFS